MKLYDVKAVARFLDLSERRVRQLRDEKIIEEAAPGLYDLKATNHKYINYLRKKNPESDENIDYNTERAKLIRAKRQKEEAELKLMEGRLHEADVIETVMKDMLVNFKVRLMAIPAKLSPVVAKKTDRAEIFKLMKSQIDESLEELADFETVFGKEGEGDGGGDIEADEKSI